MSASDFVIEMAHDAATCQRAGNVLNQVWQMPAGTSVLELSTLVAYAHSGCYVAVAHSAGEDIAASVAFFGPPGTGLHSHITGVRRGWAGRGVGRTMKMHQRNWCLERGVERITWTFDPLVARNAFFNLSTIGATAQTYLPDHYGPMLDGLNAGQGSDRLLMTWGLRAAARAGQRERWNVPAGSASVGHHHQQALRHTALDRLGNHPDQPDLTLPDGVDEVAIAVPSDIEGLRRSDPDCALHWRMAVRDTFIPLLDAGWEVTSFERPGRYILTREGQVQDA